MSGNILDQESAEKDESNLAQGKEQVGSDGMDEVMVHVESPRPDVMNVEDVGKGSPSKMRLDPVSKESSHADHPEAEVGGSVLYTREKTKVSSCTSPLSSAALMPGASTAASSQPKPSAGLDFNKKSNSTDKDLKHDEKKFDLGKWTKIFKSRTRAQEPRPSMSNWGDNYISLAVTGGQSRSSVHTNTTPSVFDTSDIKASLPGVVVKPPGSMPASVQIEEQRPGPSKVDGSTDDGSL